MTGLTLDFVFVMSEKKNGKFLYVFEHEQLYSFAVETKKNKTYRCVEYYKGCKSRVVIENDLCFQSKKWIPHSHNNCSKRFKKLKALEAVKTEIANNHTKSLRKIYQSTIEK